MSTIPEIARQLTSAGYALLSSDQLCSALSLSMSELNALTPSWEHLPRDAYLRDSGHYRSRRHACFVQDFETLSRPERVPHRPHYQSTDYNALHGGIERWFEPIEASVASAPMWTQLISGLGTLFRSLKSVPRWYVEAHQFRIDTAEGIGRPTPEGAHRDGVDFVAVILVQRRDVRGGETRVFEANGHAGVRFTMEAPWTALLLDDARVIHETTPIQPMGAAGVRDTLVLTYRARGFQSPGQTSP